MNEILKKNWKYLEMYRDGIGFEFEWNKNGKWYKSLLNNIVPNHFSSANVAFRKIDKYREYRKARKAGKVIEFFEEEDWHQSGINFVYGDAKIDIFGLNDDVEYRIKPEAVEPKYIPWTDDDWPEFLGKVFKSKNSEHGIFINDYCDTSVYYTDTNRCVIGFIALFENYEQLDGKPCGKTKMDEVK